MSQDTKTKKSVWETPLLSTKIKSANAKLFPEGALGYLVGPTLALLANSILANYFNKYMSDILDMNTWAKAFLTWLPVVSVIFVVLGNILVGRLMDRNRTKAGKARPLLLVSVPISILALLILFVFSPFSGDTPAGSINWTSLVLIAIGYNLFFALAYPCYYTSHAALVSLSTRNSKDRSLLATISNATSLAAIGLTSMILPFFLGYLFKYQLDLTTVKQLAPDGYLVLTGDFFKNLSSQPQEFQNLVNSDTWAIAVADIDKAVAIIPNLLDESFGAVDYYTYANTSIIYDQIASYNAWRIFAIALIVITMIGALIEYYFTRERVTEESFSSAKSEEKVKSASIKEQFKVCVKDKFWWIMIAFFFLYQLGGMMKNVSQLYYCQSMFANESGNYTIKYGGQLHGTLSIIGAIPTAVGMVIAWPLSNKIGKGKAILFGSIISTLGGILGLLVPDNYPVAVAAFVIKALGSTPAMYLSLALLADILDHQEAMHGFRTDGLTMTIYGAIMAGMTGIATGILNGVLGAVDYSVTNVSSEAIRAALPWIFFGGETIGYALIAVLFIFMNVEKFSKFDKKAITKDQKAKAEAEGKEYVDPVERMKMEEAEAEAASEEARKAELKATCEKKGLNYEEEEAKYQKAQAEKKAAADAKKTAADAKKAAAEKAKQDKYNALSADEKAAIEAKKAAAAKKQAETDAKVLEEFNKLRVANGQTVLEAE